MAEIVIPQVLVEAAARALHERDRIESIGEPAWEGLEELDRNSYREAVGLVLAAALAECEVREEWGVNITGAPNHRFVWWATEQDATFALSGVERPRRPAVGRRLVITTKPEPASAVDTPREDRRP